MPTFNIDSIQLNSSMSSNSASISGSMSVTSGIQVLGGITGSLLGTASVALNGPTASFITASNVGLLTSSSFSATSSYAQNSSYALYPKHSLNESFVDLGSSIKNVTANLPLITQVVNTGPNINVLYFFATYVPTTTTFTGMKWYRVNTPVFTTPETRYNGIALYSYSAGTLTLVASSSNSHLIWTQGSTATWISTSFTSPYTATRGTYFIAFQAGAGTTISPAVTTSGNNQYTLTGGSGGLGISAFPYTNSAKLFGTITNNSASLPTTQAMSGVSVHILSKPLFLLY